MRYAKHFLDNGGTMEINLPEVVAEVTEVFLTYQKAVDTNDFVTMNTLFWDSTSTLRVGPNGTLIGHAALASYRINRPGQPAERQLRNTVITTFGRDFASTNTESVKIGSTTIGRQSQCWVRMSEGWRIVAAHVSDQPGTANT